MELTKWDICSGVVALSKLNIGNSCSTFTNPGVDSSNGFQLGVVWIEFPQFLNDASNSVSLISGSASCSTILNAG